MYCDGAWDPGTNLAGIGVIVRNTSGQVASGSSLPSFSNSAIVAEASAALESKCASWEIYPLITEIRSLQGQFCECSWNLVKRGANAAAD